MGGGGMGQHVQNPWWRHRRAQMEQWQWGLGSVGDRVLRAVVGTEEDLGRRIWPLRGGLRAIWEVTVANSWDTVSGIAGRHAGTGETYLHLELQEEAMVGRRYQCARPNLSSSLSLWVL